MPTFRTALFLSALFVLTALAQPVHAEEGDISSTPWEYRLGEGMRIARTDFRLGGYLSSSFEDRTDRDGVFRFDDLSIFIFGDLSERWSLFSEFEDARFFTVPTKGEPSTQENWQIERLYVDHLYREKLNIRIGKFLTPIGTWNEIHADPLTWTASRPVVTYAAFPEFTTGVQLFGDVTAGDEEFAYSFVVQNNESINERTGFRKTHLMYAARIKWFASPGLEVGIPFAYYTELEVNDKVYLTGAELTYKTSPVELRGEATFSRVDIGNGGWTKEYGYYLQAVYHQSNSLHLVLRHEYFRSRKRRGDHKALSLAGVYKPLPQVVFKVEYQFRNGSLTLKDEEGVNDSDRFLASFSVLL